MEFVLYPRTPHGAREPKLMMDFAPRIIDWFDEHLGRVSSDPSDTEQSGR